MRTFQEVYDELRSKNRNASTIQLLKAAGEKAVILDEGESITAIDLAKLPDFNNSVKTGESVSWSKDGTITIDDPIHEPITITLDTSTKEGQDAAEKLNDMFEDEK